MPDYSNWEVSFYQVTAENEYPTVIDAVDCADVINAMSDVDPAVRETMLDEVGRDGIFICPNTTSFQI